MEQTTSQFSKGMGNGYPVLPVWVAAILGSIVLSMGAGYAVRAIYHPDLSALAARANELLIGAIATRPEPVEAMVTRMCILVFGISVPLLYYGFSRAIGRYVRLQIVHLACVLAAVLAVLLVFVDFGAINPFSEGSGEAIQNDRDRLATSNFDFFFSGFFLGRFLILYIALLVPAIASFFFVGVRNKGWDKLPIYSRLARSIGYTIVGLLLIAVFIMNTYVFPYTYENAFDFDTVYYSMTQVFAGTPMLVNDFTNTYGLYPHFLAPLFHLIGLSILKFSGVMATLVVVSFLLNLLVLRRLVADPVILFLGFVTLLFFPYLDAKLAVPFDSYFAMYPIRYFLPALMLFLALRYFERGGRALYYTIFLFLGLGILWNPEMGLICMVAWVATNSYRDIWAQGAIAYRKAVSHSLAAIVSVAVAFLSYAAVIRTVYGSWPDLALLFRTMRVFGELGFNMLPMRLVHPWNLIALILVIGYLYSVSVRRGEVTVRSLMVFMLTVVGLGFFLYFQGRSHNWSFSSSSGYAIMLLVIMGDELWSRTKRQRHLALDVLFVGFILVISFSLPEVIYGSPAIARLAFPEETKAKRQVYQQTIESNRKFINDNTSEHEKILILTGAPRQGLYFDGGKRVSAFNPTTMEMFFNSSIPRLEQVVREGPRKIFIEASDCRFGYLLNPLFVLSANYEAVAKNGNMTLMQRRSELPVMSYLNRSEGVVFHRKYRDDAASTDARIRDAMGNEPVTLDSAFSVEVLFKASQQVFPAAALICNIADSSGFVVEARTDANRYFFGIYGDGMEGRIDNDGWVYCVMNIFPDRMELFLNGQKKGSRPLSHGYRQSKEKLRIGAKNPNAVAFYTGAIAEVAIVNRPLPETEVAAIFSMMGTMQ